MAVPNKYQIVSYWQQWLIDKGFDLGEPSCWACRKWWDTKYDIDNPNTPWESVLKVWEQVTPLQRCHIVPKSLGGSDDPENLFLMCKECHDLAPNTAFRDIFLDWVEKQSWYDRAHRHIQHECEIQGIGVEDREYFIETLKSEDFKNWSNDKYSLHGNQAGYGIKLTVSTLIGLVVKFQKLRT